MVEGEPIPPSSPLTYIAFIYTKQKGKCIKIKFSILPLPTHNQLIHPTHLCGWVYVYLYVFVCTHIHVKSISKWTQASQPLLLLYEGWLSFFSGQQLGPRHLSCRSAVFVGLWGFAAAFLLPQVTFPPESLHPPFW